MPSWPPWPRALLLLRLFLDGRGRYVLAPLALFLGLSLDGRDAARSAAERVTAYLIFLYISTRAIRTRAPAMAMAKWVASRATVPNTRWKKGT